MSAFSPFIRNAVQFGFVHELARFPFPTCRRLAPSPFTKTKEKRRSALGLSTSQVKANTGPGAPPEINPAPVDSGRPAHGLQRFCSGLANGSPREERQQRAPSARPGRRRSLSITRLRATSLVAQPEGIPGKRPAWRGSSTYSSAAPAALKSRRPASPRLWTRGTPTPSARGLLRRSTEKEPPAEWLPCAGNMGFMDGAIVAPSQPPSGNARLPRPVARCVPAAEPPASFLGGAPDHAFARGASPARGGEASAEENS